jgi:hypothetical protein
MTFLAGSNNRAAVNVCFPAEEGEASRVKGPKEARVPRKLCLRQDGQAMAQAQEGAFGDMPQAR